MNPQEIIEEFLARGEGSRATIDDLCRDHPEDESELRELWDRYRTAAEMLAGLKPKIDFEAGVGVDPERYEVRGLISQGGMGRVLEVWDSSVRRTVAMKVLREDGVGGSADLSRSTSRLVNEAQILGQLEHPGIVPVHEVGQDARGRPYFTMLRVRGRELGEVVDDVLQGRGGWTVARAARALLQVCEAVAYAHSKGVIHRDLKPSNVMIGPFGEVFVMDWGLAKARGREGAADIRLQTTRVHASADSEDDAPSSSLSVRTDRRDELGSDAGSPLLTCEGDVMGTPSYMSPEQAEGRVDLVDELSDVYSAGALLYRLLSGRAPYERIRPSSSAYAVLMAVVSGPPEPLEREVAGTPELVSICSRAMARDRSRRYASMQELADDLRAYLEGRVVQAHRTGPLVELKKWIQRNKGVAAAIGVAIAGIGTVAVTTTVSLGRERQAVSALRDLTVLNLDSVVDGLVRRADEDLWPVRRSLTPELEAWLEEAERNLASIVEIAERGGGLEQETREHLERLQVPIEDVRRRRAGIERIERESVEAHREAWELIRIELRADGRYGALDLEPVTGLVPLGRDEHSGFWEFWHIESGVRPGWVGAFEEGSAQPSAESGLVLVLLPGGTFTMGSDLGPNQRPAHEVTLAPFLLSKYEVTQGQFVRCVGWNPSSQLAGTSDFTLAHPVDSPTWIQAVDVCRRWGLELPTEAQWEYAAKGGTTGPFWTGSDVASLSHKVNTADKDTTALGAHASDEVEDDYHYTAPAGALPPNPFGLHETIGNLFEWVYDSYEPYTTPARGPRGLRGDDPDQNRVSRGGSYWNEPYRCDALARRRDAAGHSDFGLGFRPALRLPAPW